MMTEGYKSPSRFDRATVPHNYVVPTDEHGCCALMGCHRPPSDLIHRVLTHNPLADEAERLRVRETFVLKDHLNGIPGAGIPVSPSLGSTHVQPPVTVSLEQAIIIAKHYLLFDELEKRAVDAEVRATTAEKRATAAEAFAASALKELSELKAKAPVDYAGQPSPSTEGIS